ncbi:MAG: DNA mismatch repair protein MutS [Elusimicrobia bacterium]|nr:DNA mismatch repair protein MutS [Candidatus Liberimonas magnetica]
MSGLTNNEQKKKRLPGDIQGMSELTPLMQQYQEIKSRYPDMVLFFRLGDFYEMFGEDAQKAFPILEVTLTHRQGYPMCGVPFHAVNSYIKKLVKNGLKVALCEQLEEPKPGAGIVKRDVVRVITPGTIFEDTLLNAKENNYLMAVYPANNPDSFGLAFVDVSTGEFKTTETSKDKIKNEIYRLNPGELIAPQSTAKEPFFTDITKKSGIPVTTIEDWLFSLPQAQSTIKEYFKLQSLKPFGLENKPAAASASGGVLAYLGKTQPKNMETNKSAIAGIKYYSLDDYLLLDHSAISNLDLVENQGTRSRENSLLETIDLTMTAMGARLMKQWLIKPLLNIVEITGRQQMIKYFVEDGLLRRNLRNNLQKISDIERILSRLAAANAGPRELIGLRNSLNILPEIKDNLVSQNKLISIPDEIKNINDRINPPKDTIALLFNAIDDEPPTNIKNGGVIKPGFNKELDELRNIRKDAKNLISQMEEKERKRTGINLLRIGFTSVYGYYIEVTKSNLKHVPEDYIRRQTLTNCERFITPELKSFEEKILSAEDKIQKLEESLFKEVCARILDYAPALKDIASSISNLDVISSLAEVSVLYNYCLPKIDESYLLEIKDGRHPVLERKIKSGSFVPNDIYLNSDTDQIILLTGPNMAGKSTYLRQTALIVILAQIGSYVPASEARIGIVDRIFTRIGASDNIAGGESTFMVEMNETASILNQFTPRSLIILDEIGRGTSTYDGISIAWSTVEYLNLKKNDAKAGPKVLFATHYFELTDLANKFSGIKNYNVAVKEWENEVIFLHKILSGPADRSYGIHVAQLAGLPPSVIKRAFSILTDLEASASSKNPQNQKNNNGQLDFFAIPSSKFLIELDKVNINEITPIDALKFLAELKKYQLKDKS